MVLFQIIRLSVLFYGLSNVDVKFSDFVFSNTSATRVYHVSNSIIELNDFIVNDVIISASFLSSFDCTVIVESCTWTNTNFEHSIALFELSGGSLTVTNLNISETIGSLFALNNVEYSNFYNLSLFDLQSATVFLFVSSNISISNISISYSHTNIFFEFDNSLMFLDDLRFIELNSSTVFDGSSSVVTLQNVNLSRSLIAHVFNLFEVSLELNNLNISSSLLTSGFMMARSTNSTLLSVDISFNNENLNSLAGLGENYLFDLIGGLFILKNCTVLNFYDNLAFLESAIAFFETVDVIYLTGSCVFNVVDSRLFLITFRLIPYNSILQSQATFHDNLKSFQINQNSHVSLLQESAILLDKISLFLNSSQLIFDDSVNISTTTLCLIAINSHFQCEVDLPTLHVLDLTSSTFESLSFIQVDVDFFWCSHCQILGNSSFQVNSLFDVNYGNFSSSIVVRESVTNSTVSGAVLLSDSFDFFRHVTLDDVSVSEFQSSNGVITCHSDVLMRNDVTFSIIAFSHTLNIFLSNSHVYLNQNFDLQEFQILSGSGVIFDNTSNSGQIIPLPLIVFDQNLGLSSSSTVTLQILNDTASTQVLVGSTLYLDGILEIEFDSFLTWSRNDFLLMESSKLIGQFVSVKTTCLSTFKVNLTSTSVFGTIDYYVAHLNEVSYISTTGVDDPCCGTLTSPCASFRGVLARMGRKGKVYLHQGKYSFNITTKISDMDWEVIGLGDVQVTGFAEILFEVGGSNFSVTSVNIVCNSDLCFSVSNSSFSLNNSLVIHDSGVSTSIIDSSTVYVSNCNFESNSSSTIQSNDSLLILMNVAISGFADECSFIVENSVIEIFHGNFTNIVTPTLFYLNKSQVMLNHSSCSNSNFSLYMFDLFDSELNQFDFTIDSTRAELIYRLNFTLFNINDCSILSTTTFGQLMASTNSEIQIDNSNIIGSHSSDSIIFVSNSTTSLYNNLFKTLIATQSLNH
ncbi:hypothetical protein GEMRC1_008445 [Eukaryota sp. GEM-RC1]